MTSIMYIFGSVGGLFFPFFYQLMDKYHGPLSTCFLDAMINFGSAVFFALLALCGLFGNQKNYIEKEEDETDEEPLETLMKEEETAK